MSRVRILTPDEIDVLELRLGGVLVSLPPEMGSRTGEDLTLADAENTPVALLTAEGEVHPQKPLALAAGPLADPRVRVTTARDAEPGAVALWVSAPFTLEEETELEELLASRTRVLLVVPSSRDLPPAPVVHPSGLLDYASTLAGRGPRNATAVVAWPRSPQEFTGLTPADLVPGLGVDRMLTPIAHRGAAVPDIATQLDAAARTALEGTYSSVAVEQILAARAHAHPRGQVLFFTGLSGSGKSTIAKAVAAEIASEGRTITLLDGDEVRHHLSRGLGFSREDRETNIERIGYVASLVGKHGGQAIAAPIAPFASGRRAVRELADSHGAEFRLIWVSTPLEVCEARDRKGLYAKARAGEIPDFTGISSPYEEPEDADLVIDAAQVSVEEAVARVRDLIR